ncbi:hypothetical protein M2451_002079 [Dysgonomonas sp. PFB1-18]|uniref:hypothetical protein n=1 Tax=unclassified Dysgonomonas TaxID=2630389 RepID=UPI002476A0A0|nr:MULTISPECIES: hypothetical protein [unclassified Dysgonomonas]MDH6309737.1 hypothetical protein [Dysgonomonas sp. PF1-14]MDH6339255.1 hypothetical protein [Dysgonomonas sp. PF1-16]MDH6380754.1 hypothetical protein [Dysgonomonas sp. PFB1-18]MDH6398250.1 hypothetical protein [Dysgonomonas sp. PF1-23]
MEKLSFLLIILVLVFINLNCTDDNHYSEESTKLLSLKKDVNTRLSFSSSEDLVNVINSGSYNRRLKSAEISEDEETSEDEFVSMLEEVDMNDVFISEELAALIEKVAPGGMLEEGITYYEALGYDTLVPNVKFAALLNPFGELEVLDEVIKITPEGTYKYPKDKEKEFLQLMASENIIRKDSVGEKVYELAPDILLIDTYQENVDDIVLVDEGECYEIENLDIDLNNWYSTPSLSKPAPIGPDYDSFQTFSDKRKTWAGKIIQNIFQTSVTPTVNFSKDRRIRGKFYHYNWFVYTETGVSGWTDKKNWIGWSKTNADELRIGWRGVVLETKLRDNFSESIQGMQTIRQFPPVKLLVPGASGELSIIPVYNPDISGSEIVKYAKYGVKPLYNFLKGWLTEPNQLEKAQAVLVTNRTHMYTIILDEEVIKYNEDKYTHVFANQVKFAISLNLIDVPGFSSWSDAGRWANSIKETSKMNYPTLKAGEVYTCGRFGNVWRGLKIVKKD